jgi:homoserine O-acetyltransferase
MLRHTLASKPFRLDANETLPQIELAYQTWGTLNADRSNAVLVAHALTGSADVEAWWSGIVGPDKLIDPKQYFVICINTLGSCYGSTGPESINPDTTAKYVATFPEITIRDIARTQLHLLQELGISEIALAIGGSMGGMVILELGLLAKETRTVTIHKLVAIAAGSEHSAWRVAFSSTIRKTIQAFEPLGESGLCEGLRIARQLATISYRASGEFGRRFGRKIGEGEKFEVENYLEHQGQKIVDRFSVYSYLTLTRAMELYDLTRGKAVDAIHQLEGLDTDILLVGISSDILYLEEELRTFAKQLPNARYETLLAECGHDSFLIATDELAEIIRPFLEAECKWIITNDVHASHF